MDNACYIGNISGANVAPGTAAFVLVDADGKLGTVSSSRRFKKEIKPMDKASEVILALKPVTLQYNYDKKSRPMPEFGLIAEEVAEVNPDLVVRDTNGEVMTVRYEAVCDAAERVLKRTPERRGTAEHNRRTQGDRRAAAEADYGSTSDRCTTAEAD